MPAASNLQSLCHFLQSPAPPIDSSPIVLSLPIALIHERAFRGGNATNKQVHSSLFNKHWIESTLKQTKKNKKITSSSFIDSSPIILYGFSYLPFHSTTSGFFRTMQKQQMNQQLYSCSADHNEYFNKQTINN